MKDYFTIIGRPLGKKYFTIIGLIALSAAVVVSLLSLPSSATQTLPTLPPPAPLDCTITPHKVSAAPGTKLSDCQNVDPWIPHTAAVLPGEKGLRTTNVDGTPALYCASSHGGVEPVAEGTTSCDPYKPPPLGKPPFLNVPGAPPEMHGWGISCGVGQQSTTQIKDICETGNDPGVTVNGGAPIDPNCTGGHDGCFDLKGREHDASGKVVNRP